MAFPFGSTSLAAYISWAHSIGCTCQSGLQGLVTAHKIKAPSGLSVTIVGVEQAERLSSSYLNHLDRRLGIKSPFDRIAGA